MPVSPPRYALDVLRALEARGFEARFVGGCVRDLRLRKRPLDWDVCTNALPEAVMEIFPRSIPTGIKHGTVTVISRGKNVEVTTYRTDGAYADYRRPGSVAFVGDLREDLARRDFTINAVAMDRQGRLFDPFGGLSDIEERIIRCVGDPDKRFQEDALRMLRALRLSAVLGFEIEDETRAAIWARAALIRHVAMERISVELTKALLSPRPETVAGMLELGVLRRETGAGGDPRLRRLKRLRKNAPQRWSALSAFLSQNGAIDSPESFLSSLRLDTATVKSASKGSLIALEGAPGTETEWKRLLAKYGGASCACAAAAVSVLYGFSAAAPYKAALNSGDCHSLEALEIKGRDLIGLGFRGEAVGKALDTLLEHVINFPEDNTRETLIRIAQDLPRG